MKTRSLRMARMDNLSAKESELMSRRQQYQWDQINMRTHALEEGLALGEARGVARGVALGEVKGKAHTLLHILEKRLGVLPRTIHTLVEQLDFLQLEKLEDRVLELDSVRSLRRFLKQGRES